MTAGHCVCDKTTSQLKPKHELDKVRVVFRYHKDEQHRDKTAFNQEDVYKIREVLFHSFYHSNANDKNPDWAQVPDWALIKLDRAVVGIQPIQIDFLPTIRSSIYTIGCPKGTAVKCAGIGYSTIKKISSNRIESDTDTFAGNSGSPLIDRATHKAIAIHTRGHQNYTIDRDHKKRTGERRVISFRITQEMIASGKKGYAISQRIPLGILDFHKCRVQASRNGRSMFASVSCGTLSSSDD